MEDSDCNDAFGCFSRLFNQGSLINLDFLSDENLGLAAKDVSGDSEEVMLSEMQSGEEISPEGTKDYEYGGRDDDAAEDYAKKTTTETEYEEWPAEETIYPATTTVPQQQVMDVQSNVVPAPTETSPVYARTESPYNAADDPDEKASQRHSDDGVQELSVGQYSPREADFVGGGIADETVPVEQRTRGLSFLAPDGTLPPGGREDEGNDPVAAGQCSSPTLSFDKAGQGASSSPEMFATTAGRGEESPDIAEDLSLKNEPIPENKELTPADLSAVAKTEDPYHEVDLIRQTMQSMEPAPEIKQVEAKEPTTQPGEMEGPSQSVPPPPPVPDVPPLVRKTSGPSDLGSKKGGISALSLRRPKGGATSSKGPGSSSSSPPKSTPPAPRQEPQQQSQQQQSRDLPAGIGSSGGLRTINRRAQPSQTQVQPTGDPPARQEGQLTRAAAAGSNGGEGRSNVEPPETVEARRKLLEIRLTVLRIASRLGMKPLDFSVTDFMAKIDRTEQLRFRGAGTIRPQLDALFTQAVSEDERFGADSNLGITVTAIVIGTAGSGKSSVIRNLLHPGPQLAPEMASEPTDKVVVHTAKVSGINFKLIDTPGLSVAASALRKNMNILKSVRAAITKHKPDTVIYVDRMDYFRRELSDIPLLRLVNDMLPELLYNCVALLTRASAPPPDAGNGTDMPYVEYQRLRLDLCTQIITHAISDMRWAGRPLGFENHPNCALNSEGIPVLPNGFAFKKNALFQLISSHMSGQMEKVCKTRQLRQRTMEQMMFMMQPRKQLQLSALVSQLLSPKPPKKFPDEERELMTKREIRQLKSEAERIEEENKRRDYTRLRKVEILQEEAHPSQVPIVGANMELNPSFDHDVNQHRYNATDFVYGWSIRPIMSAQESIYEHDDGVEMFQVARDGVLRRPGNCVDGVPASMIVQAGKGKNFGNIQLDTGFSHYTTRNFVTTANVVVHPAGQDGEVVYTPTVDVRAKIAEKNKVTVGGMACRLAESGNPLKGQLGLGGKLENKYKIKEGVKVTGAVGVMTVKPSSSQARDASYGANLELKLAGGKGEYDPNFLFSGAVSHQRRGTYKRTGFSGQLSAEQAISPETMINGRLQLSPTGSGTASLRMITHDKPQTGWLMAVPLVIKGVKRLIGLGDEYV